jgi:hypothetical protein
MCIGQKSSSVLMSKAKNIMHCIRPLHIMFVSYHCALLILMLTYGVSAVQVHGKSLYSVSRPDG